MARLAGLPKEVVQYASQLLKKFEQGGRVQENSSQLDLWQTMAQQTVQEKTNPDFERLIEAVRGLEIQKMTPLDALNKIAKWQQELS